MTAAPILLAAEDSNKAGPIGLLVIILLGIACYFLYRSMSRHLRKVRDQFPEPERGLNDDVSTELPTTETSAVDTSSPTPTPAPTAPQASRERFVPPVRPTHAVTRPDDTGQE